MVPRASKLSRALWGAGSFHTGTHPPSPATEASQALTGSLGAESAGDHTENERERERITEGNES